MCNNTYVPRTCAPVIVDGDRTERIPLPSLWQVTDGEWGVGNSSSRLPFSIFYCPPFGIGVVQVLAQVTRSTIPVGAQP